MTDLPLPEADSPALRYLEHQAAASTFEIRPSRGLFDLGLGAVWRYRELLIVLTMRDIQVLYKQAALGIGWAVIQPLFAVVIFTIVFGHFAKMPSDGIPYAVFALAGVLC
jgi:lipopolysaccharide transport system permease protein